MLLLMNGYRNPQILPQLQPSKVLRTVSRSRGFITARSSVLGTHRFIFVVADLWAREQYANINEPPTAQTILRDPNSPYGISSSPSVTFVHFKPFPQFGRRP